MVCSVFVSRPSTIVRVAICLVIAQPILAFSLVSGSYSSSQVKDKTACIFVVGYDLLKSMLCLCLQCKSPLFAGQWHLYPFILPCDCAWLVASI